MIFKRGAWFTIAVGVVVINVLGGIYAYLTNEPFHAFIHGAFAVGFGLWARYLQHRSERIQERVESADEVELLQGNLSELERELRETQERLDFADQLLRKKPPTT